MVHRLLLCVLLLTPAVFRAQALPDGTERPRLIVLVVVDQLATWVLDEAWPHLGDDGFRRLAREGVRFMSCAYDHACTSTGPGHASIGTGASPLHHGIIGNAWFDRDLNDKIYCTRDPKTVLLGATPKDGGSPILLRAPGIGDTLKTHFGKTSKVVSIAWKDRSAIMMGGLGADLALWVDNPSGNFVTSTWYGKELPAWVAAHNGTRPLDRYFANTWKLAGQSSAYAGLKDDRPFEQRQPDGSCTLPRIINGGAPQPCQVYYEQLRVTPFANDGIVDCGLLAMERMALGTDTTPDLLCIGLSANDYVGHAFGPRSVEVRDITLQTDQLLARLLDSLDQRIGQGRYLLALTADHGIAPSPEGMLGRRLIAGRFDTLLAAAQAANRALTERYGPPPEGFFRWVLNKDSYTLFLDRKALKHRGIDLMEAADIATEAARTPDAVERTFNTLRLFQESSTDDRFARSIKQAVHPDRSGEVYVVPRPYWIGGTAAATHGSLYPYDQEVPLMVMGARGALERALKKAIDMSVSPRHIAPIVTRGVGIPRPPFAPTLPPN